MAIIFGGNPHYYNICFQLNKIEKALKEIVITRFLEIFSLTGACCKCSSYQQPGRRRGNVTFGVTTTQANMVDFASIR